MAKYINQELRASAILRKAHLWVRNGLHDSVTAYAAGEKELRKLGLDESTLRYYLGQLKQQTGVL